ncbi:MAG: hypothetical protein ACE5KA_08300 [Nitrososphaerales archaeon]
MKSTKTLAAMSSMLLVLSATIATSAFAFSELREQVAVDTPTLPVQPNRGSFLELPRQGTEVTALDLDAVSKELWKGQALTITGKLITENGEAVANAAVRIIDHSADSVSSSHDSTSSDVIISSAVTDSEGFFEATWMPHEARTYTIYGQFNGTHDLLSSKSDRMTVSVL